MLYDYKNSAFFDAVTYSSPTAQIGTDLNQMVDKIHLLDLNHYGHVSQQCFLLDFLFVPI